MKNNKIIMFNDVNVENSIKLQKSVVGMQKMVRLIFLSLLIVLLGGLLGCGKKAPPVALSNHPLQSVKNLTYSVNDNIICLKWEHPELPDKNGGKDNKTKLAGFTIHRSKISSAEDECIDCPILFKRVGDVAPQLGIYCEPVIKGYQYRYKVTAYTKNGNVAPDSNAVLLKY